jgi:CubicO group peptidase (beta-lactamase class C family)
MSGGSGVSPAGPNREAFGHSGLGGSIAMADPKAGLAIALVLDRIEPNLLTDDRGRRVIAAALAATEG